MRAVSTLCVMVLTLWAAVSMGTAYRSPKDTSPNSFSVASTTFSVDLMKEVFKEPGNCIMSPLSVSTLLAMLQHGAKLNSSRQLDNILHMNSSTALAGFSKFITSLKVQSTNVVFNFGNSMFVNQEFTLSTDYRDAMVRRFHAEIESVNFGSPAKAARQINEWVSNVTQGKIQELVRPEAISSQTKLVLANAMYFNASWMNPFYPPRTQRAPFYKEGSVSVDVDMMAGNFSLRAGVETESLNAKWLEMNYDSYGMYSMVVVLPNDNLDAMLTRMTSAHLTYLATEMSSRDVILKMPKFKIESDLSLVPTLQALGLSDVFNQRSNLGGIGTKNRGHLIVSEVLHKAQIDVNEYGSEASAATGILAQTLSLKVEDVKMDFNANKPFLAIIIDKVSTLPLFIAKVADPSRFSNQPASQSRQNKF